ncbi:MAG: HAMP domain-containing histidine kinase [Clostridia bacterium]|nr:HAMP domain-containing histidine kinase [Clostridia bacterium]
MKTYRMKEGVFLQSGNEAALAAIAHDLRTPMCCVSGAAQLALQISRQGQEVDAQMHQILRAVDTMDKLLSAACETGRRQYTMTAKQLEQELYTVLGLKAERKRQRLSIDFSALDGCVFAEESGMLIRILTNLISNAVKYTPEYGNIKAEGRREGSKAVFHVIDNGMGMKRAFLQKMFVPYERAKESAHLPGHGLGLPIVRSLVHKLHGRIAVYSTWGKGTTFIIRIPIRENAVQ